MQYWSRETPSFPNDLPSHFNITSVSKHLFLIKVKIKKVLYKVKLKNADEEVLLDDKVYEFLTTDPYLVRVDFINNLRRHSSGCAVFQKNLEESGWRV